ncbi:MAG: hypothetical protein JWM76_4418 [Pseudonocardiales bacterium]|nr:hypothetical protein [Pseudonocardiales bacterium]
MARTRDDGAMAPSDPLGQVQYATVTSTRQAARIAYRWTLTNSPVWQRRPWVGWLAVPFTWWVNLILIGCNAGDIVHWNVAAAKIPNRDVRPRRRHWPTIALAVVIAAPITAPFILPAPQSGPPSLGVGIIYLLYLLIILVLTVAATADNLGSVMRSAGGTSAMHARAKELRASTGGTVVVASNFGAWPRHTGAGGELLEAVLDELGSAGVSVLANASNAQVAGSYVQNHHAEYDDRDRCPLRVIWRNLPSRRIQGGFADEPTRRHPARSIPAIDGDLRPQADLGAGRTATGSIGGTARPADQRT